MRYRSPVLVSTVTDLQSAVCTLFCLKKSYVSKHLKNKSKRSSVYIGDCCEIKIMDVKTLIIIPETFLGVKDPGTPSFLNRANKQKKKKIFRPKNAIGITKIQ